MCHQCDYANLLEDAGLKATVNRLKILEVVGNNNSPLSAQEIFQTLNRTDAINRVTVYRILDLLVTNGLVDRITSGGRSFRYGLAPNGNHRPHPHFYCKQCGHMECLNPESLEMNLDSIHRIFPGIIDSFEVRLDGTCKTCLKKSL
jgi:Fur family ferric uptake transcriptional regulator